MWRAYCTRMYADVTSTTRPYQQQRKEITNIYNNPLLKLKPVLSACYGRLRIEFEYNLYFYFRQMTTTNYSNWLKLFIRIKNFFNKIILVYVTVIGPGALLFKKMSFYFCRSMRRCSTTMTTTAPNNIACLWFLIDN